MSAIEELSKYLMQRPQAQGQGQPMESRIRPSSSGAPMPQRQPNQASDTMRRTIEQVSKGVAAAIQRRQQRKVQAATSQAQLARAGSAQPTGVGPQGAPIAQPPAPSAAGVPAPTGQMPAPNAVPASGAVVPIPGMAAGPAPGLPWMPMQMDPWRMAYPGLPPQAPAAPPAQLGGGGLPAPQAQPMFAPAAPWLPTAPR